MKEDMLHWTFPLQSAEACNRCAQQSARPATQAKLKPLLDPNVSHGRFRQIWRRARASSTPPSPPPPPNQCHRVVALTTTTTSSPSSSSLYLFRSNNELTTHAPTPPLLLALFYRARLRLVASYAASQHGAAGRWRGGWPVDAGHEPAGGGLGVGAGAGDRAEEGGDARDAARPPGVRVRALAHRPRRQGRRRGRGQRQRGAAERKEGGGPRVGAGADRVDQAGRAGGEVGEEGVREAAGGRRREQPPQQQRRRPAQLLHAPLPHPQLHRAAPRPHAVRLRRPGLQRLRRLEQEGERRRHRQVLVAAVGSTVAEVQPARPERAAQRVDRPRDIGGDPESGKTLCSTSNNLKTPTVPSLAVQVSFRTEIVCNHWVYTYLRLCT